MKPKKTEKQPLGGAVRARVDAFFGDPYVECRGWRQVTVGGARRIELLTKERIVVRLDKGFLSVCGRELICTAFRNGSLCVEGEIDSVGRCEA